MSLPLCPVCGGTGTVEVNDEGSPEYGGFTTCPFIATGECVAVKVVGEGLRHQDDNHRVVRTTHLDASKVVPWCETHNEYCDAYDEDREGWFCLRSQQLFYRPDQREELCRVVAAVVTTIGEYA